MTNFTLDTVNIFFPSQVEPIYSTTDEELQEKFLFYWKLEKDRCMNGFFLADGQVKISGRLYFHCVYGKIARYVEKEVRGEIKKIRTITQPLLRDIDWDIFNDLEVCSRDGKFYALVGSRDFGKSIIAASCTAHNYTFFGKSESLISSGDSKYIKLTWDKVEDFLLNIHPIFLKQRLKSDWKSEISAGWKDKLTNLPDPKSSFSLIKPINYEMGNKSMAANGTRPGFPLFDEIGTMPNLIGCFKDSDGCWWSGGGDKPSCLVMLAGCVCAGTKVFSKEGKLLNIKDIKQSDGLIGFNGQSIEKQEINWFKAPAKKPCYRISYSNGEFIECSDDHPLLITKARLYKKGSKTKRVFYQEAKNLEINDQLILPSEIPVFGEKEISYSRELGLLIGDGNYSIGATPSLSCSESEIYDYITNKYKCSFSHEYEIEENKYFSQINITGIKDKLQKHGIYGQSKNNKRLPNDIHTFNKKSLANLLAGYFDADGNVYYNSKKKIVRIVLTSVVKELLIEVKYQLLKFGIHSHICTEQRNTKPSEDYKGQQEFINRLYINQQQDVQIFKENIHLLVKSKKSKLDFVKNSKYKKFNGFFEINFLNNKEGYFNNDLLENLRYVTINNIEFIGDKDVYNLNCGPNHNYLSNGLITRQTGGDMEKGKEASQMFYDPYSYNLLEFENEWEGGGKIGRFISALRAKMKYKEPKTLSSYLGISHPDLDAITILVSNEEKALKEWWEVEHDKALKSGNSKTLLKFKAYWPLKPSDSFIVLTHNNFNTEAAKAQQAKLKALDIAPHCVEIYHDGDKLTHKTVDKLPITEFPLKTQDPDAPVQMWEAPIEAAPFGLYVAGVDPYRQGQAEFSDSLGAVYIFKRMNSIIGEGYQNMFVAAYVARPESKDKWNETARNLIKYYNARTLCENDEYSFIDYMISKGDGHFLEDQPEWLKEYVPNTTVKRGKGIHRSSLTIRNFLDGTFKSYLDEIIHIQKDESGSITKETTGVSRIPDIMLLEEICKFSTDTKNKVNTDRVVAAELAVALAFKLNPIIGSVGESDKRIEAIFANRKAHALFSQKKPLFKQRKTLFNGNY